MLHTYIISLLPVLFFYSANFSVYQQDVIYIPLILSLGIALGLLFIFRKLLKSINKAAIYTSYLFFVIFLSGPICALFYGSFRKEHSLILSIILLAAGFIYLKITTREFKNTTRILNILSIILLAVPIWSITAKEISTRNLQNETLPIVANGEFSKDELPDIYYIILDAYSRDDVLKKYFNFDNTPFIEELEKRGFYVARQSYSNYDTTRPSMASSLNSKYIDNSNEYSRVYSHKDGHYLQFIEKNTLFPKLKQLVYKIINSSFGWKATNTSWNWGATAEIENLDFEIKPLEFSKYNPTDTSWEINRPNLKPEPPFNLSDPKGYFFNKFVFNLLKETPFHFAYLYSYRIPIIKEHSNQVDTQFKMLANIGKMGITHPHFLYMHITCPHLPFLFDAKGEHNPPSLDCAFDEINDKEPHINAEAIKQYTEGYAIQITAINKKILDSIDSIFHDSTRPKIIILQSDHGNRSHPQSNLPKAQLAILNAYYGPEEFKDLLYPSISPVNTFRVVSNYLLESSVELLPERYFFFPEGASTPEEVTRFD